MRDCWKSRRVYSKQLVSIGPSHGRIPAANAQTRATKPVAVAIFCGLLLAMFGQTGTAFAQEVTPEEAAAIREYRVAIAFQKKKLFAQAAVRWTQFLQKHPKDKRLPSAHLNLGVSQFGDRNFPEAAAVFRDVLAKYGGFEQRDRAQFNLGMCHYNTSLALQDTADATKTEAEQKKAQAAAAAEFRKAAVEFDKLVKGFAKSVQLATVLMTKPDLNGATAELSKLLTTYAKSDIANDAKYLRGDCQFRQKESPPPPPPPPPSTSWPSRRRRKPKPP